MLALQCGQIGTTVVLWLGGLAYDAKAAATSCSRNVSGISVNGRVSGTGLLVDGEVLHLVSCIIYVAYHLAFLGVSYTTETYFHYFIFYFQVMY